MSSQRLKFRTREVGICVTTLPKAQLLTSQCHILVHPSCGSADPTHDVSMMTSLSVVVLQQVFEMLHDSEVHLVLLAVLQPSHIHSLQEVFGGLPGIIFWSTSLPSGEEFPLTSGCATMGKDILHLPLVHCRWTIRFHRQLAVMQRPRLANNWW